MKRFLKTFFKKRDLLIHIKFANHDINKFFFLVRKFFIHMNT